MPDPMTKNRMTTRMKISVPRCHRHHPIARTTKRTCHKASRPNSMALPSPKKGTAPATGKLKKPSRADFLLSATQELAAEQLPEEHTMSAIEGERAPAAHAPEFADVAQRGPGQTAKEEATKQPL